MLSTSLEVNTKIKIISGKIKNFARMQQRIVDCIDKSPDVQHNKTNLKTKMTDWRMHKFDATFIELADFFKSEIESYQKTKKSHTELTVTDCWGAHYTSSGKAVEHSHYPALWSGVAYVKLLGKCQPTVFPECNYSHSAEEGSYIMFPGWLRHYVDAGSDNRYIVAFNIRALNISDGRH